MLEREPFIIAEMACAHHGEIDRAYALIDAAVAAGVDAVQIQIFRRSHQVAPNHYLYPLLGELEFSSAAWESIVDHARNYKVALYAFVYDVPSLELALMLDVDGLKLSSSDLSNPALLERAALTSLPVYLGTGASKRTRIHGTMKRRIFQVATRIACVVGLLSCLLAADPKENAKQEDERPVRLTIDYADGAQKRYTAIPYRPPLTVLDALNWAAQHPHGIEIDVRGEGETALVTRIDDLKNQGSSQRNWIFRVNGKLANRGCGVFQVRPGDAILWRFEKYR